MLLKLVYTYVQHSVHFVVLSSTRIGRKTALGKLIMSGLQIVRVWNPISKILLLLDAKTSEWRLIWKLSVGICASIRMVISRTPSPRSSMTNLDGSIPQP